MRPGVEFAMGNLWIGKGGSQEDRRWSEPVSLGNADLEWALRGMAGVAGVGGWRGSRGREFNTQDGAHL